MDGCRDTCATYGRHAFNCPNRPRRTAVTTPKWTASAGVDTVEVVRGWLTYDDGSQSPVERWVRAADGDWISLDSTRRTSGDIHMEVNW